MLSIEKHLKNFADVKLLDKYSAIFNLLSPYHLRLFLPNRSTISIGRFSAGAIPRLVFAGFVPSDRELISIGSFCEFAQDAVLLIGQDHSNESVFNYTYSSAPIYKNFINPDDYRSCYADFKHTVLEDNVLISLRSLVLGGSTIGFGSIVAAGAIVAGRCLPNGLYAGVPARRIRDRLTAPKAKLLAEVNLATVAAEDVALLPKILKSAELDVSAGRAVLTKLRRLKARSEVHIEGRIRPEDGRIALHQIKGFSVSGHMVSDSLTVQKLTEYFNQALRPQDKISWIVDIFEHLDLT